MINIRKLLNKTYTLPGKKKRTLIINKKAVLCGIMLGFLLVLFMFQMSVNSKNEKICEDYRLFRSFEEVDCYKFSMKTRTCYCTNSITLEDQEFVVTYEDLVSAQRDLERMQGI